jgi:hypothetical protein
MTTPKTIYPSYGDYNLSVAHLPQFAREPRLARAQPQKMSNGNLAAYSGGYSRVYPVQSGSGKYALRCWTADVGDAQERYRQIGAYLAGRSLPYFVEFDYLERALVVKGQHYPVLWMEWAEGPRLREFVGQNLGNKPVLRQLAQAFREMVADLHAAQISHGDLQDENIIVQNGPSGPRLKLIDYDSLYVPALHGYADQIIGVSHYQHPRRNTLRTASDRVDYFSELVIYLSLLVYEQNPGLWNARAEKQLLFSDSDYLDPLRSPAFQQVLFMTGEVRTLTERLIQFCHEGDLLRLEPLEAVTAGTGGGSASSSAGRLGGLDDTFLSVPPPATRPAPAPPQVTVPGDLLRTPARPDPVPWPAINVPGDLLSPPPRPQPAPAPSTVPDGLLVTPPRSSPQGRGAAAPSAPPAQPAPAPAAPAVRTASPSPPAPAAATVSAQMFAPPAALHPVTLRPVTLRPVTPSPPSPAAAVGATVRAPATRPVDWATVARGFAFGALVVLLILLLLVLEARERGVDLLGAAAAGCASPHGAPACLAGAAGAPRMV